MSDHAVDADDPIEWAVLGCCVDCPGNPLWLLLTEVREELAPDPPTAATVIEKIRELQSNGLLIVESVDGQEVVDDPVWQEILDEYARGIRKQDADAEALDDDVYSRPTDAGFRRAVAIGAMIDNKGTYS